MPEPADEPPSISDMRDPVPMTDAEWEPFAAATGIDIPNRRERIIPICCICQGDGVLEALGSWYCVDHAQTGLLDVACFVARLVGWDVDETEQQLTAWMST